jgi:hypothetical protein
MTAFRQEGRVCLFYGSFDGRRFDCSVVDEKKDSSFLDVVISVRSKTRGLEAKLIIRDRVLDQLVGNRTAVNLANPINSIRSRRSRDADPRVTMFAARESDSGTMYRVPAYHVEDLGILFTCRAKGATASGDVVEKIFHLESSSELLFPLDLLSQH